MYLVILDILLVVALPSPPIFSSFSWRLMECSLWLLTGPELQMKATMVARAARVVR